MIRFLLMLIHTRASSSPDNPFYFKDGKIMLEKDKLDEIILDKDAEYNLDLFNNSYAMTKDILEKNKDLEAKMKAQRLMIPVLEQELKNIVETHDNCKKIILEYEQSEAKLAKAKGNLEYYKSMTDSIRKRMSIDNFPQNLKCENELKRLSEEKISKEKKIEELRYLIKMATEKLAERKSILDLRYNSQDPAISMKINEAILETQDKLNRIKDIELDKSRIILEIQEIKKQCNKLKIDVDEKERRILENEKFLKMYSSDEYQKKIESLKNRKDDILRFITQHSEDIAKIFPTASSIYDNSDELAAFLKNHVKEKKSEVDKRKLKLEESKARKEDLDKSINELKKEKHELEQELQANQTCLEEYLNKNRKTLKEVATAAHNANLTNSELIFKIKEMKKEEEKLDHDINRQHKIMGIFDVLAIIMGMFIYRIF